MKEVVLTISGMTCGGCVNSVTRVLQSSPGVQQASVTLIPSRAVVNYDESVTSIEKLSQAVADAGFSVAAV